MCAGTDDGESQKGEREMKKITVKSMELTDAVDAMLDGLLMLEANGYTAGGDVYDSLACAAVRLADITGYDVSKRDLPRYITSFIK